MSITLTRSPTFIDNLQAVDIVVFLLTINAAQDPAVLIVNDVLRRDDEPHVMSANERGPFRSLFTGAALLSQPLPRFVREVINFNQITDLH